MRVNNLPRFIFVPKLSRALPQLYFIIHITAYGSKPAVLTIIIIIIIIIIIKYIELRKKLVRCYVWSFALYGSETWTLRKLERSIWRASKCGAGGEWRR